MRHRIRSFSIATLFLGCLVGEVGCPPQPAVAALYTVGPGGTHATIQAAVDAAAAPGFDEIRIHSGTYFEAVSFNILDNAVTVSGGWNDGFTSRSANPLATRVTLARKPDKGFAALLQNGVLRLIGMTFEGGFLGPDATRPFVVGARGSVFEMSHCVVRGHTVRGRGKTQVLAMQVATYEEPSSVSISDSRFSGNRAVSAGGRAPKHQLLGGALLVAVVGDDPGTVVELARNVFEDNVIEDAQVTAVNGIGLSLMVGTPAATVKVIDSVIRNNRISSPISTDDTTGLWASVTAAQGTVLIDRTLVLGNTSSRPASRQMHVVAADGPPNVKVTNSLVARGSGTGFHGEVSDDAALSLDGLTLANNGGEGYRLVQSEQGTLKIVNSVLAGNGVPPAALGTVSKLRVKILGLSHFVDAAADDYRLKASSSAVDAGINSYNVHGELDLAGKPRLRGPQVDLGAYEVQ